MFGISVNEVPGWLVAMAPSAIGVPVAAWPGLVPHCDVSTVPVPAASTISLRGTRAARICLLIFPPRGGLFSRVIRCAAFSGDGDHDLDRVRRPAPTAALSSVNDGETGHYRTLMRRFPRPISPDNDTATK